MKNKPTRHKETNTFKFKRFSERVSEIDVDVFHRVAHRYEEQKEDVIETFFFQTLQKWSVLNLTEGYTAFKKEVQNIVTLPQLLNRKQEVIDILMKYLKQKDNQPYLQPILDLIVAVARDLQKEFYEYFPDFLSVIIDLLQTKDAEQLEHTLTALAYLFKFLWRYLIKNVDRTFDLLLPLLGDSKPPYINNFAAESFAYVVRKVRDRDSFFRLVLRTLQDKKQGIPGCGRLMFEVISGTTGQFHSCAEPMLTLYLEALEDQNIDQELVYSVLEQIFTAIMNDVHPQKCEVFWTVIHKFIDRYTEAKDASQIISSKKNVSSFFRLVNLAISHRNGRMLINPVPLIKRIVRAVDVFQNDEEILRSIIDVSVAILLASQVKLSQETSSELVLKLLSIQHRELTFHIVERLVDYSSFETLVLPHVLRRTIREGFDAQTLRLFAKIVSARSPPRLGGVCLKNWRKFSLDIRGATKNAVNFVQETLESVSKEENVSEDAVKAVIILPHLNPVTDDFAQILKESVIFSYEKLILNEDMDDNETEKWSFYFLVAIESAAHIFPADAFHDFVGTFGGSLLELLRQYPENENLLNAVDLSLTQISESKRSGDYLTIETFEKMNELLAAKLSAPLHRTRLTVTHIYSLFRHLQQLRISEEKSGSTNALELMFLAENEAATVHKYRDRLVHLQALTFHSQALTNLQPKYYDFPLRYLMGNLWINFSLLWDPVCKAIATYATKECAEFWPVFLADLKAEIPKQNPLSVFNESLKPSLFKCDVIATLTKELTSYDDKPDYLNHKLLLWKCMVEFTDYCEAKNRDITGLFIENVENNYFKSNTESARSWSIEKKKDASILEPEVMEIESEDEEEDEEAKKASKASPKKALRGPGKSFELKLLLAQMKVFAKVNNPKTLYRESEMNKIYMDLLTSKNVDVQKAALDCLFAYKLKYLVPYKENLYSLVDEKNLKNELARFRIDEESSMLKDEHREGLMPILMRLIYAKMVMRIGTRTGGKGGALVRRKIILRFLAGSQEEEMLLFTRMAFKPFEKFVPLDLQNPPVDLIKLVHEVSSQLDLSNVIPPKRLRSAVNLLAIVIEQFGAKMMENLLPRLLAILVCILTQTNGILKRSENVLSGYLPTMKTLRTTCIGVLARFFTHFETYAWKPEELDAVFEVGVFPLLEKLPMEGIHSPTALLKLFAAWAENPRYYQLLVKHQAQNPSLTPLPYVMRLLLAPKTHLSVIHTILEMLQKMLTLQDVDKMETDEEPAKPLVVTNVLSIQGTAPVELNYGSAILMPHVAEILQYMKKKLERSSKGVNRTELVILSRLSELAKDGETSDRLLTLLLPILVKRASRGETEETILELLTTIVNLVKNVEKPEIHLRAIVPLLGTVSPVPARKLLLKLIDTIAKGTSALETREIVMQNADLLLRLNAWDQKWIEQPDFEKRLDAFAQISATINDPNTEKTTILTLEFGVAVIYTCYFFLRHESDLSLRDSSGQCLKSLGPKLAKMYRENNVERRYLIDDTVLSVVKNGIRSKNDVVRNQSIAFLGEMALECPEVHPVLRDLALLANREDREVDFFENLQHLQLHRRARALLKFCSLAKSFKRAPNARTLTQFIFPVASSYLCNEAYANKNSIVDAAIETVGTVCRLLPWHHYEIILKHYLDKLGGSTEFQRQIVRIVVAILDAFHYDLSKLKNGDVSLVETAPKVETEAETPEELPEAAEGEKSEKELTEETAEAEELLDEALTTGVPEEAEEEKETVQEIMAMEKQTVLSQYVAKRLVFGITHVLLPRLHRSIIARTQHEMSHKVNRRKTGAEKEDEELMRVPIALAMVKLLQKLPLGILNRNLPGIFMKLCTFLKSRLDSVRRATREILQKIMITLGPDYLHHLLREMNALLTKGFQIHVLAYTIHAVLISLKPFFKETHMSDNLQSILSVCKIDLFGQTAEEKEIAAIAKSVSEARSTKSFDIFGILGQFIPESCLLDLILPLREVLSETRSHRTVHKAVECLRHVVLGLADNSFIPVDRMLVFLYGIVSESIPELLPTKKPKALTEKETEALQREKPDCYLIAPEPKSRMGVKATAKTSADTNAHVMMEFALKLCHILLKRERVAGATFRPYLDPFVPILANCLDARRVKLSTLSLQCLNWVLKMDLPTVRESVEEICSSIFAILHKYAASGLSKGDNFDLVMASFKCMSVLVRDVKYFTMTSDQTKALILYAEQDLHDSDKQATAFNLLKAIISRKIIVPEMHTVMEKVATLSVTSELDHVRQQSRSVFYSFLMEYPLGKHLDKHISFYLSQLSYEMKPGRLSALEMIHNIVTGFPVDILVKQSGLLFLMVGVRLINDEDPACRKLCAKCIKETITRVPHNQRVKLFDIVKLWMKDQKITHRTLAAQLCGVFVTVEKEAFESRLAEVLPLVLKQFHAEDSETPIDEPGRFVRIQKPKPKAKRRSQNLSEPNIKDPERMKDHHLFQVLQLSLKISANCPALFKNEIYEDSVHSLAEYSQSLLGHPHLWVRLASTQLIGFVLAGLNEEKISRLLENPEEAKSEKGYIYSEPMETLRSLSLDLAAQLQPDMEFEELADQVVKNLVFVARVIKSLKLENTRIESKKEAENGESEELGHNSDISILWLLRRMRKCVNVEVTQAPKSTSVRMAVFKWIAGVVATISVEQLKPVLFQIMSPLVREIATTEESNAPLRHLAKEVATMIKRSLGNDEYAKLLVKVQQKLDTRRTERKKVRTQQYVTDPELAAKRKIARQQKKKEARKRRLTQQKGKRTGIKKPRREVDLEESKKAKFSNSPTKNVNQIRQNMNQHIVEVYDFIFVNLPSNCKQKSAS